MSINNSYFNIVQSITMIPKITRYHINNLKSFFLRYLSSRLIHNKPITNDVTTPTINIGKFAIIRLIVQDFKRLNITAPNTTAAYK